MRSSRRQFLEAAAAVGVGYGARRVWAQAAQGSMSGMKMGAGDAGQSARTAAPSPNPPHVAPPMLHTLALAPFADALPLPEVVRPTAMRGGKRQLTMTMREVFATVHRDVAPTRMWSYGVAGRKPGRLAPLIEARSGEPLSIRWVNELPGKHFLPIDHSLHGAGRDVPEVRAIAHLHGAKVLSQDDGYPEDWFVPGQSRVCHYPFAQEATALWYHDHAMGINRINIYAGLFGMLLLRDEVEDSLRLPAGKYEVPLIFYDRDFTAAGQLFYDVSGDPASPWIPEFSADGILVNGKIRPYFEVEPRLYRFRMLNAANSRFFNLSLSNGQALAQIGSDQGLLGEPVPMQRLVLGCAERADVLVDFSKLAGQTVRLRTGALEILEFRVARQAGPGGAAAAMPKALRPVRRIAEASAVRTRTITLHEYKDDAARSMVMLLNRKRWHEPTTEFPKLNTTEIWEFVNLTEDTHPMHLHMVRFQILDRRAFDRSEYVVEKRLRFTDAAQALGAHEMGWKDVVQCPAGMVTRIVVPFEGYPGKYLYHCHILEHEANDMMRPFEVVA